MRQIKPIYNRKNRLTFKGLLRMLWIIFTHILAIAIYFGIIESIAYFEFHSLNLFKHSFRLVMLGYLLFLGPIITALAHIFYLDTGYLSLKAFVWLHTWTIMIVIALIVVL